MNAPPERLRVQYGAGWMAAPGWLNFDSSPSLWLERLPVVGGLIKINKDRFPADILFGDIVKGLPVEPGSVASIYASHVLEHLCYDDFWRALTNTYDALQPGGVFRLIVPDLEGRARRYLKKLETGDPDAASRFLEESFLGQKTQAHSLAQRIRKLWGHSDHLWMWDEPSITEALRKTGFVDVRRCRLGDAADPSFAAVERADRFADEATGDIEIAIECKKPGADGSA